MVYESMSVELYVSDGFQIIIFPLVFEVIAFLVVHHILHDNEVRGSSSEYASQTAVYASRRSSRKNVYFEGCSRA